MEWIIALGGGLILGLAHSLDPDHVAAMSTLVQPGATRRNALRAGLLWGIGHSLVLSSLVLLLIWLGFTIRPVLETGFEVMVGCVLIGLGLWRLSLALHGFDQKFKPGKAGETRWLPVVVGMLHGLAGSAGAMILIPVLMLDSLAHSAAYLLCFSVGSILSMMFFTGTLAAAQSAMVTRLRQPGMAQCRGRVAPGVLPPATLVHPCTSQDAGSDRHARAWLSGGAGAVSFSVGVWWLAGVLH